MFILFGIGVAIIFTTFKADGKSKHGNDKKKHATLRYFLAFLVIIIGFGQLFDYFDSHQTSNESAQSSSVSHKHKASSSSSDDDSLTESEQKATHKLKMKNIADQLNDDFSQNDELSGFSIKADGSIFKVTVPDNISTATDNEQKETYSACASLVEKAMGNEPQMIYFYSNSGLQVAHTAALSGAIKLDN